MRSPLCVLQTDYMGVQNMYDNLELLLKDVGNPILQQRFDQC